jgi:phosphoribosylformylglycinamidine synthase subunit PurQ / glutaminase
MAQPRVLILRGPGTNCDEETAFAFLRAGGDPHLVHVNRLVEQPQQVRNYQILCIPGGFSYGDDLAAGRVLALQMQLHLQELLQEFRAEGKLILGICNGFQVLLKAGVILEPDSQGVPATLAWNVCGKYEDRWIRLRTAGSECVFLQNIDELELPVAHAEGRFVPRNSQLLEQLQARRQLVLHYARNDGTRGAAEYPDNPNGSVADVAGVSDASGRVFGLMPHPERYIDATHHPRWTRSANLEQPGQGLALFQNAVRYFAAW